MHMRPLHLFLATLILGGCKPTPKISTYEVKPEAVEKISAPNGTETKSTPMQASPAMQAEAATFGRPNWAPKPSDWVTLPANRA